MASLNSESNNLPKQLCLQSFFIFSEHDAWDASGGCGSSALCKICHMGKDPERTECKKFAPYTGRRRMYVRAGCLSVEVFRTVRATAAAVGPGAAPRRARVAHTVRAAAAAGPEGAGWVEGGGREGWRGQRKKGGKEGKGTKGGGARRARWQGEQGGARGGMESKGGKGTKGGKGWQGGAMGGQGGQGGQGVQGRQKGCNGRRRGEGGVGGEMLSTINDTHIFKPTTTCIAQAPVTDRFELSEVSDQNHRDTAKGVFVRVQALLAEI